MGKKKPNNNKSQVQQPHQTPPKNPESPQNPQSNGISNTSASSSQRRTSVSGGAAAATASLHPLLASVLNKENNNNNNIAPPSPAQQQNQQSGFPRRSLISAASAPDLSSRQQHQLYYSPSSNNTSSDSLVAMMDNTFLLTPINPATVAEAMARNPGSTVVSAAAVRRSPEMPKSEETFPSTPPVNFRQQQQQQDNSNQQENNTMPSQTSTSNKPSFSLTPKAGSGKSVSSLSFSKAPASILKNSTSAKTPGSLSSTALNNNNNNNNNNYNNIHHHQHQKQSSSSSPSANAARNPYRHIEGYFVPLLALTSTEPSRRNDQDNHPEGTDAASTWSKLSRLFGGLVLISKVQWNNVLLWIASYQYIPLMAAVCVTTANALLAVAATAILPVIELVSDENFQNYQNENNDNINNNLNSECTPANQEFSAEYVASFFMSGVGLALNTASSSIASTISAVAGGVGDEMDDLDPTSSLLSSSSSSSGSSFPIHKHNTSSLGAVFALAALSLLVVLGTAVTGYKIASMVGDAFLDACRVVIDRRTHYTLPFYSLYCDICRIFNLGARYIAVFVTFLIGLPVIILWSVLGGSYGIDTRPAFVAAFFATIFEVSWIIFQTVRLVLRRKISGTDGNGNSIVSTSENKSREKSPPSPNYYAIPKQRKPTLTFAQQQQQQKETTTATATVTSDQDEEEDEIDEERDFNPNYDAATANPTATQLASELGVWWARKIPKVRRRGFTILFLTAILITLGSGLLNGLVALVEGFLYVSFVHLVAHIAARSTLFIRAMHVAARTLIKDAAAAIVALIVFPLLLTIAIANYFRFGFYLAVIQVPVLVLSLCSIASHARDLRDLRVSNKVKHTKKRESILSSISFVFWRVVLMNARKSFDYGAHYQYAQYIRVVMRMIISIFSTAVITIATWVALQSVQFRYEGYKSNMLQVRSIEDESNHNNNSNIKLEVYTDSFSLILSKKNASQKSKSSSKRKLSSTASKEFNLYRGMCHRRWFSNEDEDFELEQNDDADDDEEEQVNGKEENNNNNNTIPDVKEIKIDSPLYMGDLAFFSMLAYVPNLPSSTNSKNSKNSFMQLFDFYRQNRRGGGKNWELMDQVRDVWEELRKIPSMKEDFGIGVEKERIEILRWTQLHLVESLRPPFYHIRRNRTMTKSTTTTTGSNASREEIVFGHDNLFVARGTEMSFAADFWQNVIIFADVFLVEQLAHFVPGVGLLPLEFVRDLVSATNFIARTPDALFYHNHLRRYMRATQLLTMWKNKQKEKEHLQQRKTDSTCCSQNKNKNKIMYEEDRHIIVGHSLGAPQLVFIPKISIGPRTPNNSAAANQNNNNDNNNQNNNHNNQNNNNSNENGHNFILQQDDSVGFPPTACKTIETTKNQQSRNHENDDDATQQLDQWTPTITHDSNNHHQNNSNNNNSASKQLWNEDNLTQVLDFPVNTCDNNHRLGSNMLNGSTRRGRNNEQQEVATAKNDDDGDDDDDSTNNSSLVDANYDPLNEMPSCRFQIAQLDNNNSCINNGIDEDLLHKVFLWLMCLDRDEDKRFGFCPRAMYFAGFEAKLRHCLSILVTGKPAEEQEKIDLKVDHQSISATKIHQIAHRAIHRLDHPEKLDSFYFTRLFDGSSPNAREDFVTRMSEALRQMDVELGGVIKKTRGGLEKNKVKFEKRKEEAETEMNRAAEELKKVLQQRAANNNTNQVLQKVNHLQKIVVNNQDTLRSAKGQAQSMNTCSKLLAEIERENGGRKKAREKATKLRVDLENLNALADPRATILDCIEHIKLYIYIIRTTTMLGSNFSNLNGENRKVQCSDCEMHLLDLVDDPWDERNTRESESRKCPVSGRLHPFPFPIVCHNHFDRTIIVDTSATVRPGRPVRPYLKWTTVEDVVLEAHGMPIPKRSKTTDNVANNNMKIDDENNDEEPAPQDAGDEDDGDGDDANNMIKKKRYEQPRELMSPSQQFPLLQEKEADAFFFKNHRLVADPSHPADACRDISLAELDSFVRCLVAHVRIAHAATSNNQEERDCVLRNFEHLFSQLSNTNRLLAAKFTQRFEKDFNLGISLAPPYASLQQLHDAVRPSPSNQESVDRANNLSDLKEEHIRHLVVIMWQEFNMVNNAWGSAEISSRTSSVFQWIFDLLHLVVRTDHQNVLEEFYKPSVLQQYFNHSLFASQVRPSWLPDLERVNQDYLSNYNEEKETKGLTFSFEHYLGVDTPLRMLEKNERKNPTEIRKQTKPKQNARQDIEDEDSEDEDGVNNNNNNENQNRKLFIHPSRKVTHASVVAFCHLFGSQAPLAILAFLSPLFPRIRLELGQIGSLPFEQRTIIANSFEEEILKITEDRNNNNNNNNNNNSNTCLHLRPTFSAYYGNQIISNPNASAFPTVEVAKNDVRPTTITVPSRFNSNGEAISKVRLTITDSKRKSSGCGHDSATAGRFIPGRNPEFYAECLCPIAALSLMCLLGFLDEDRRYLQLKDTVCCHTCNDGSCCSPHHIGASTNGVNNSQTRCCGGDNCLHRHEGSKETACAVAGTKNWLSGGGWNIFDLLLLCGNDWDSQQQKEFLKEIMIPKLGGKRIVGTNEEGKKIVQYCFPWTQHRNEKWELFNESTFVTQLVEDINKNRKAFVNAATNKEKEQFNNFTNDEDKAKFHLSKMMKFLKELFNACPVDSTTSRSYHLLDRNIDDNVLLTLDKYDKQQQKQLVKGVKSLSEILNADDLKTVTDLQGIRNSCMIPWSSSSLFGSNAASQLHRRFPRLLGSSSSKSLLSRLLGARDKEARSLEGGRSRLKQATLKTFGIPPARGNTFCVHVTPMVILLGDNSKLAGLNSAFTGSHICNLGECINPFHVSMEHSEFDGNRMYCCADPPDIIKQKNKKLAEDRDSQNNNNDDATVNDENNEEALRAQFNNIGLKMPTNFPHPVNEKYQGCGSHWPPCISSGMCGTFSHSSPIHLRDVKGKSSDEMWKIVHGAPFTAFRAQIYFCHFCNNGCNFDICGNLAQPVFSTIVPEILLAHQWNDHIVPNLKYYNNDNNGDWLLLSTEMKQIFLVKNDLLQSFAKSTDISNNTPTVAAGRENNNHDHEECSDQRTRISRDQHFLHNLLHNGIAERK